MSACQEFAVLAQEGRRVDGEEQAHCGLVDGDAPHGLRLLQIGHGVANLKAVHASDGTEVAAAHVVHFLFAQAREHIQLFGAHFLVAVCRAQGVVFVGVQVATVQPPNGNPPRVLAVIQRRDLKLWGAFFVRRLRHVLQDDVQQVGHVFRGVVPIFSHPAVFGRSVDGGEVKLFLGGVEVEHQVKHLLLHQVRRAVFLVHLVDHHDGFEPKFNGLPEHKSRLGHGPLEGVDQQQHGIGHLQHALHLAAEICVTRSVDQVDFHVFPSRTDVFGQNGDPALTLEVVVVQNEFPRVLAVVDDVALVNDFVDEGGFPVVDVGDDGHVADAAHEGWFCGRKGRTSLQTADRTLGINFARPKPLPCTC